MIQDVTIGDIKVFLIIGTEIITPDDPFLKKFEKGIDKLSAAIIENYKIDEWVRLPDKAKIKNPEVRKAFEDLRDFSMKRTYLVDNVKRDFF